MTYGGPSSCLTLPAAIAAAAATNGADTIRMLPGSYCPITISGGYGNLTFVGAGLGGLAPGTSTLGGSEAELTAFQWDSARAAPRLRPRS